MFDILTIGEMLIDLTQSGIPVIYSGDEIAQLNDESYHDDPDKKADSRYLHRGKLDWKKGEKIRGLSEIMKPYGFLWLLCDDTK